MLFKSTTIVTSAVSALFHNPKGQLQAFFISAAAAVVIIWRLCICPVSHASQASTRTEAPAADQKTVGMKWSYDEMARKLIVENTDLAYAEISEGFTKGIGQALNKVTRQSGGKPVVVNL